MKGVLWVLLVLLFSGCQEKKEKSDNNALLEVTTVTVKNETLPADFEYFGFAESSHPVEIRARVEGYLNKILYKEGRDVKQGDNLFEIDPLPFQAAVNNALGDLKAQEAILWEAAVTVDRLRPLYEKKAASQRDLDNAIATKLAAEASVESAQARLKSAQLNLGYTVIRSPVTGLSTLSNYREGALIIPQSGLLTTISVINPIWIKFNVSGNDLQRLAAQSKEGRIVLPKNQHFEVELTLADGSIFPYKGKVDFAAPTLDPATGTLVFRATLSNPDDLGLSQLKPGEFVRVKLSGAEWRSAIAIPQTAVQQGQNGMYVFVINKEGQAETRSVEVGEWYKDRWLILGGLQPGDEVIVEGVNKVVAGQKVKTKPGAQ